MEEIKKQKIIRAVIDEKIPLKDIAPKLFITEKQLKLLLESWGVELPRKRRYTKMLTPERQSLMVLYRKYGSTQKVAEHFGVGINTVNRWMKELKIPMKKMRLGREEKLKFLEEHLDQLNNINL